MGQPGRSNETASIRDFLTPNRGRTGMAITEHQQAISRAHSEPLDFYEQQSRTRISSMRSRSRRAKSCRSEMDMTTMSEKNRQRLFQAFLPDIKREHSRMGFTHKVNPFNLNQEGLKTVQVRAKTTWDHRLLPEHSDVTLGRGQKAANSTTPRPLWVAKSLPMNSMNDKLFPEEYPALSAYVKRQHWDYRDLRHMKRPLPKRTDNK